MTTSTTTTATTTSATTASTASGPVHVHTARCWWDLLQARWVCPGAPVLVA